MYVRDAFSSATLQVIDQSVDGRRLGQSNSNLNGSDSLSGSIGMGSEASYCTLRNVCMRTRAKTRTKVI